MKLLKGTFKFKLKGGDEWISIDLKMATLSKEM